MTLFDLPQHQIKALLATGAPVWMTVNPVEYHGPHLSLHNDLHLSRGVIRDLYAALQKRGHRFELLIADDIEAGVGPAKGPGSRHTPFETVRALVANACERLADLGAQKVILVTFHGDPLHNVALDAGVQVLKKRGVLALSPFNNLLAEMLALESQKFAPAYAHIPEPMRSVMLNDMKFDFHAGFFETSLTLHYAPHTVSEVHKTLPPSPAMKRAPLLRVASAVARRLRANTLSAELEFAAVGIAWPNAEGYNGYTGAPAFATAQAGAFFAEQIITRFAEVTESVLFRGGEAPQPIMRWAATLSLGGRLA
jgi:creatinine amidohydrolase